MAFITTRQFQQAEELRAGSSFGGGWGFFDGDFLPQFIRSKTPQASAAPVPVVPGPQPLPAVPDIQSYSPPAQLPPVRILPPVDTPSEDDPESGRVQISLPTQIPVFIPEPARPIPPPPVREEPVDDRDFGEAIETIPIPYLPPPRPATVPQRPAPVITAGQPEGDEDMAIDWGDIFTTSIPQIIEGFVGGGTPTTTYTPVPSIPATYSNLTATGAPRCKRRRRRRLLTESDFNDLMRIATLPNKQNVAVALAKAVGRR